MQRVSWTERSNEDVLRTIDNQQRTLIDALKKKKRDMVDERTQVKAWRSIT